MDDITLSALIQSLQSLCPKSDRRIYNALNHSTHQHIAPMMLAAHTDQIFQQSGSPVRNSLNEFSGVIAEMVMNKLGKGFRRDGVDRFSFGFVIRDCVSVELQPSVLLLLGVLIILYTIHKSTNKTPQGDKEADVWCDS